MAILSTSGTSKSGKSTFIKHFQKKYKKYGTPSETYRDIPNLKLYGQGTQESQARIRDFMYDQAKETWAKRDTQKNVIHDRCLLDNLAATMILMGNGDGTISDSFFTESMEKTKASMEFYHCVYYFPIESPDNIPLPESLDKEYRLKMNIILESFVLAKEKDDADRRDTLFPEKNCTYIERVTGASVEERLSFVSEILDENGAFISEEESQGNMNSSILDASGNVADNGKADITLDDFGFEREKINLDV